ncbi:hypothetical protein NEDG_02094 [Nematocida displodere]|uniref:Uncharacterized protein n=1 Tax=Nematocida displodere TaxID=1805483 RepID=A0A177EJN7_9MICR|nr:hypothetical protein NEDG_02094 [Nematocida displodere]
MILSKKAVAITTLLCLGSMVRGIGIMLEKVYDATESGYLYSYGAQKFLGADASPYVETIGEKNKALKLKLKYVHTGKGVFAIFMSDRPEDQRKCSRPYKTRSGNTPDCFYQCPTLAIKDRIGKTDNILKLQKFKNSSDFKFLITIPVLKGKRFFKIYHKENCLAAHESGSIWLERCDYSTPEKQKKQLFQWHGESLFQDGVEPTFELNPNSNPAHPHHAAKTPDLAILSALQTGSVDIDVAGMAAGAALGAVSS